MTSRLPAVVLEGWRGVKPPNRAFNALRNLLPRPKGRGDGGALRIEELSPADTGLLILHFAMLGNEGRKARFNSSPNIAALIKRYKNIDWSTTRFLGVRSGRKLVAVLELALPRPGETGGEELAVSVLPRWQGAGLGERLVREAQRRVCEQDGQDLYLFTTADNAPMIRLAHRLGFEAKTEGQEYYFVCRADRPADATP